LVNAYKIDGVPSLGVAGKYYVDGTLAKGMTRALQITEQLAKDAKPA
jgi:thiol:disulfide interchange protein DsbA